MKTIQTVSVGKCNSARLRFCALCCAAVFGAVPAFAELKLSAKSYVREGLMCLWDGKENAGYGKHSATPSVWTDLVGGNDLTLPTLSTVLADGLSVVSNGNSYTAYAGNARFMVSAATSRQQTIECAYNQTESFVASIAYMLWFGSHEYLVGLTGNNTYVFGTHENTSTGNRATYKAKTTLGQHSFACAQDGTNRWIRVDGEASARSPINAKYTDVYVQGTRGCTALNLGYMYDANKNAGFNGTYHCLRCYNRALSLEETQVNRIIDCVRYFGGEPSDYTLPAGWRWAATDIQIERKATIVPTEGGTFTYGGSPVTAATETWVAQGEGTALALAATPADGYAFSHWKGVAPGDMFTQSGSLVVLGGEVRPVFYQPQAGGEGLYKGLVYDMALDLENADNVYNAVENMKSGARTYAEKVGDIEYKDDVAIPAKGSPDGRVRPLLKFTTLTQTTDATYVKRPGLKLADWGLHGDITVRVQMQWEDAVVKNQDLTIPFFANGYNYGAARGLSMGVIGSKNYKYDYIYLSVGGLKCHSGNNGSALMPGKLIEPGATLDFVVALRKLEGSYYEVKTRIAPIVGNCQEFSVTTNILLSHSQILEPLKEVMQMGSDDPAKIGDTAWQKDNLNGLNGYATKMQVWNRALSDEEIQLLISDATGEKWTIGAPNGSSDEFANVGGDEAESTFKPYEMPWRNLPKALTAANPSVTISGVMNPDETYVVDEGFVKFLTVYAVTNGLPSVARVNVAVNGTQLGSLDLAGGQDTLIFRRREMAKDENGLLNLTLTRDAASTGDIQLDAIQFGGGERYGALTGSITVFNVNNAQNGLDALGVTNVAWVYNRIIPNPTYNTVNYRFNVPKKAAKDLGLTFSALLRCSNTARLSAYINGVEVYASPDEGQKDRDVLSVRIDKSLLKPGINDLSFVRADDTKRGLANNDRLAFGYLKFDFDQPKRGMVIIVY